MTQGQRMLKAEQDKKKKTSTKHKAKSAAYYTKKVPIKAVFESFLSPVPTESNNDKNPDSDSRAHKRHRSPDASRHGADTETVNPDTRRRLEGTESPTDDQSLALLTNPSNAALSAMSHRSGSSHSAAASRVSFVNVDQTEEEEGEVGSSTNKNLAFGTPAGEDRESSICRSITSTATHLCDPRPPPWRMARRVEGDGETGHNDPTGSSVSSATLVREYEDEGCADRKKTLQKGAPPMRSISPNQQSQSHNYPETPPLRAVVSPGSQPNSFRSFLKLSPPVAPLSSGSPSSLEDPTYERLHPPVVGGDETHPFAPLPPSVASSTTEEGVVKVVRESLDMAALCGEDDDDEEGEEWIMYPLNKNGMDGAVQLYDGDEAQMAEKEYPPHHHHHEGYSSQQGTASAIVPGIYRQEGLTTTSERSPHDTGNAPPDSITLTTSHGFPSQTCDPPHACTSSQTAMDGQTVKVESGREEALETEEVVQSADDRDGDEVEEQKELDDLVALGLVRMDCSGFRNPGNDCYACSVVSLLIRNKTFISALHKSFPAAVLQWMKLEKRNWKNASNNSSRKLGALSEEEKGEIRMWSRNFPVHSALCSLLNSLRQRKFLISLAKGAADMDTVMKCEGLLEQILELDFYDLQGQVLDYHLSDMVNMRSFKDFQRGISLSPLKNSLPEGNIFFSGYQEDAHEFLIYLLDCLEKELVPPASVPTHDTQQLLVRSTNGDPDDEEVVHPSNAANTMDEKGEENTTDNPETDRTPPAGSSPSALKSVWINKTTQGRLLNIVRCRNKNCLHEIVTLETFVNLGISLPTAKANSSLTPNIHSCCDSSSSSHEMTTSVVSVQTLLQRTLEYERLGGYVCDHCRSSLEQYQGGCFFGEPPPLLFLQIKRFDAHYDPEKKTMIMSKNRSPVDLTEMLHVMTLPDTPLYYDGMEKRFSSNIHQAEIAITRITEGDTDHCQQDEEAPEKHEKDDQDKQHNNNNNNKTVSKDTGMTNAVVQDGSGEIAALEALYRLQGVVEHHGLSIEHGHYTCAFATHSVKHEEAQGVNNEVDCGGSSGAVDQEHNTITKSWYCADDREVRKLNLSACDHLLRASTECYLLVYERVEVKNVSCSVEKVMPKVPPLAAKVQQSGAEQ